MACIIQALPYDLPPFLPALITSFVRHVGVPSLKDTVTRTVQMFKGTHPPGPLGDGLQACVHTGPTGGPAGCGIC